MPSPTRRGCLTCARVERRATRCCRSCGTMGQCEHQRQCHHQGQRDQQEEGPWREANICDSAQTQAPAQAATKPCAERTGVWRKVSRSTEIKNRRNNSCLFLVSLLPARRALTHSRVHVLAQTNHSDLRKLAVQGPTVTSNTGHGRGLRVVSCRASSTNDTALHACHILHSRLIDHVIFQQSQRRCKLLVLTNPIRTQPRD